MNKQSMILAFLLVFATSVNVFAGDLPVSNITSSNNAVVTVIVNVLTQIVNLVP